MGDKRGILVLEETVSEEPEDAIPIGRDGSMPCPRHHLPKWRMAHSKGISNIGLGWLPRSGTLMWLATPRCLAAVQGTA